jgi:hypothetical protein
MFDRKTLFAALAVPLIGFSAAGCNLDATAAALAGAPAASSSASGLSCEIVAHNQNGMLVVEPVIHAPGAVSGSYQFHVTGGAGGNSANIMQGSGFATGPDGTATLGRVMLGANGSYDASLSVSAGGETASCSERLG